MAMPSPKHTIILPQGGDSNPGPHHSRNDGFSLIEMMVSVLIILLLMSAIFPFIMQSQKRFQANQVISESNQSARAALEVMTQEIGQAGYNPQFYPNKTASTSVILNGVPYWCITVSNITGINPGDWVSLDTGANNELLEVFETSTSFSVLPAPNGCQPATPTSPWIQVKPLMNHTAPYIVSSYKMPYGGGLLYLSNNTLSNRQRLQFYGDINQDGKINYVVYSISPMVPAATVTIKGVVYTLYNLYRSITTVPFPSIPLPTGTVYTAPNNNIASPMVEKVLFNTTTAAACTDGVAGCGPTGQPLFGFPDTIIVGVIPNQITVVGTIKVTLCVAVNPQSLETRIVQWYTMATQIRPLNLSAAINVNNTNGGLYLPPNPKSVPMLIPSGYYP
jgi:prepilin-type N-terminal cleavage/methylation domain-containing protein